MRRFLKVLILWLKISWLLAGIIWAVLAPSSAADIALPVFLFVGCGASFIGLIAAAIHAGVD